jgi:hypothetical protein
MIAFPRALAFLFVSVLIPTVAALAQETEAKFIDSAALRFSPTPIGPSVAPGVGSATQPGGLYVVFAKYEAGVRSLPHTHPDQRVVTVLSGTFYAGSGPAFDAKAAKPQPTGSVFVIPANVVHWGFAKDGAVLLQETGVGPSGLKIWPTAPAK